MNTESKSSIPLPKYWGKLNDQERREWCDLTGQAMPESSNPKQTEHGTRKAALTIFTCLVGLCAFAILFTEPAPRETTAEGPESSLPTRREAYDYMKQLMLGMVKSPTQTSFQAAEDISIFQSENYYRAEFWMDSPNSFGVMLREHYTIALSFEEAGWVLTDMAPTPLGF